MRLKYLAVGLLLLGGATPAKAETVQGIVRAVYTACDAVRTANGGVDTASFEQFGFQPSDMAARDFADWSLREGATTFDLTTWSDEQLNSMMARALGLFEKASHPDGPSLFSMTDVPAGTVVIQALPRDRGYICTGRTFHWTDADKIKNVLSDYPGEYARSGPRNLGTRAASSGFFLLGQNLTDAADAKNTDTLKLESAQPPTFRGDDRPILSITFDLKP